MTGTLLPIVVVTPFGHLLEDDIDIVRTNNILLVGAESPWHTHRLELQYIFLGCFESEESSSSRLAFHTGFGVGHPFHQGSDCLVTRERMRIEGDWEALLLGVLCIDHILLHSKRHSLLVVIVGTQLHIGDSAVVPFSSKSNLKVLHLNARWFLTSAGAVVVDDVGKCTPHVMIHIRHGIEGVLRIIGSLPPLLLEVDIELRFVG